MLWIEPCDMFYAGMMGVLVGAGLCWMALRRNEKEHRSMIQSFWNEDIRRMQASISSLDTRIRHISSSLSTDSGENPVKNR
jgi:hypothetical protein